MFFVYVLRSLKDENLYIGQSNHVGRRVAKHNSGQVPSTKGRRPLKLVHVESFESREEAVKREKELKTGQWREVLKEYF